MKIEGLPHGLLSTEAVAKRLDRNRQGLYQSRVIYLLDWYEVGRMRLFTTDSVNKLACWLQYRGAQKALGETGFKELRPPRLPHHESLDLSSSEDTKSRRAFLDAWFDEGVFEAE